MAKNRTYSVKLIAAEVSETGRVVQCVITDFVSAPKQTAEAGSLSELESKVRDMAQQFGQSCAVHIDVARGERKPGGFDAFTHKLQGVRV
jgi:hypothetical protein